MRRPGRASLLFLGLAVLNMVAGFSLADILSPLTTSWSKALFGIDLYGIDTMIILSAIILFFESQWRIFEPLVVGAVFLGVIVLLSVYK